MTTTTFFRKVLTATAVGVASFSFAQTFEQGGITYKVMNATDVAVYRENVSEPLQLQGDIVIPAQVEYNGNLYNVTMIGDQAFYRAGRITSVTLPETIIEIGREAFYICQSLTSINLPQSLEGIGKGAFGGCWSLKEIVIPNQVREIHSETFAGCLDLNKIVLPKNMEDLKEQSLMIGWGLETIVSNNPNPPELVGDVFITNISLTETEEQIYKKVTLRVPVGSKALYETTDWKYFNIVEDATLSITENKANTSVSAKVYPNPTTGIFFIETEMPTTAQIVSITGQNIKSVKLNKGKNQVDISNVASGLYFVKIGDTTAKIIKK